MSEKTLNAGIIGAGWWATFAHIPAIQSHPNAKLLAVQCRTQDKADRVVKDFDAPHALTDIEDLLNLPELDAVVIATTPNVHYEQAKAALAKGINTSPTWGMEGVYVEPNIGSYNDPAIAGGGQIYCQVSHAAAYITFLTGLRPAEVYAKFDFAGIPNDIYDALNITLENGALVNLASTGATPASEFNYEVRVYGTKGILLLELWQGTLSYVPFEGERVDYPKIDKDDTYPGQTPALNLIDAALGLKPNGSDGKLGLASMEIIEAACNSAKDGVPVKIR